VTSNQAAIEELISVMDKLLGEGGCPWDREQTHESLARYLIEETYEAVEAIQKGDQEGLCEELGDILLQVVFHAALAKKAGHFDFADIARGVSRKMIQRHPHVFGDLKLTNSEQVLNRWEGFKQKEGKKYLLQGIPRQLPALMRAEKLQEKASRVGFDWPDAQGAIEKIKEEIDEVNAAQSQAQLEEELGDLFFALVNFARLKGIDAEKALQASNNKFISRFNYVEKEVIASQKKWADYTLPELDALWDKAKDYERQAGQQKMGKKQD